MRKNKRYFRKKWVKIDQILVAPGPSEETFCSLKDSAFDSLGKQLSFAPKNLWFSLNTSLFPTCAICFRKALIAATDREKLKHLFPRVQESTLTSLHLMQNGDSSSLIHYSPRQACAFFDYALEAELRLKKEQIPPLLLMVPKNTLYYAIAKNLKNQWETVLNIRCMIQSYPFSEFHKRLSRKKYHLALIDWEAPTSDPLTTLMAFKSATDPLNFSHFENFYYQKLLKIAAHETEPLKREMRIKELEKILIDHACVLPLF